MAEDWGRLGAALVARRTELGYAGRGRAAFGRARGLTHTRTIDDLENGRRRNYSPAALAQVEQVYGWRAGSVAAVLGGGEATSAMPGARLQLPGVAEWDVEIVVLTRYRVRVAVAPGTEPEVVAAQRVREGRVRPEEAYHRDVHAHRVETVDGG